MAKTKRTPLEERLWPRVDKHGPVPEHRPELGPCWVWLGQKNADGYGLIGSGGSSSKGARNLLVHHVTYELVIGARPEGLEPDHLCELKACCNPSHVEYVTHLVNVRRGKATGFRKTHCRRGHLYDAANTTIDSAGQRRCRECVRLTHSPHPTRQVPFVERRKFSRKRITEAQEQYPSGS